MRRRDFIKGLAALPVFAWLPWPTEKPDDLTICGYPVLTEPLDLVQVIVDDVNRIQDAADARRMITGDGSAIDITGAANADNNGCGFLVSEELDAEICQQIRDVDFLRRS